MKLIFWDHYNSRTTFIKKPMRGQSKSSSFQRSHGTFFLCDVSWVYRQTVCFLWLLFPLEFSSMYVALNMFSVPLILSTGYFCMYFFFVFHSSNFKIYYSLLSSLFFSTWSLSSRESAFSSFWKQVTQNLRLVYILYRFYICIRVENITK